MGWGGGQIPPPTPQKPDNNLCIYLKKIVVFFLSGEELRQWMTYVRDTIGRSTNRKSKSGSAAPKPLAQRPQFLLRHGGWLAESISRIGFRTGSHVSLNCFWYYRYCQS